VLHIANLVLRFLLELAALVAVGYWGFATQHALWLRLLCGIGLPVAMAAAWAVFRVPGDGGRAVVVTPPQARLGLEIVYFGLAVALLRAAGQGGAALLLLAILVLNYALDYRRTFALLSGRGIPRDHLPAVFRPKASRLP
jgi:hypothetical protein